MYVTSSTKNYYTSVDKVNRNLRIMKSVHVKINVAEKALKESQTHKKLNLILKISHQTPVQERQQMARVLKTQLAFLSFPKMQLHMDMVFMDTYP